MAAARTGRDVPVIFSEWGFASAAAPGNTTAARHRQAVLGVRALLFSLLRGMQQTVWYDLIDDGDDPTEPEHTFGLLERDGATPKPAYTAIRTPADLAPQGVVDLAPCDTGRADLHCLVIEGQGRALAAIWTHRPGSSVTIHLQSREKQRIVDLFGRPISAVAGPSGTLGFELCEADGPVYVELTRTAPMPRRGGTRLRPITP